MKWQISTVAGIVVIALYRVFTFLSWTLYPTTYSPTKNWLSDLGNSTRQSQRCNPLQFRMHPHWNRIVPVLRRSLQMVHNGEMAKNNPHRRTDRWICSRLRINDDRCFLRRRGIFARSLVKHILPAESSSSSLNIGIFRHTSTLHKSHTSIRISRDNNQLGFHLRVRHTSS